MPSRLVRIRKETENFYSLNRRHNKEEIIRLRTPRHLLNIWRKGREERKKETDKNCKGREEKVERDLERNPAKERKEKKGLRAGNKREGATWEETFFENPRERKREKRSKIKWFLKEKERRVLT